MVLIISRGKGRFRPFFYQYFGAGTDSHEIFDGGECRGRLVYCAEIEKASIGKDEAFWYTTYRSQEQGIELFVRCPVLAVLCAARSKSRPETEVTMSE